MGETVSTRNLVGWVVNQYGERHAEGGGKSRPILGFVLHDSPDLYALFPQLLMDAFEKGKVNWHVGQETLKKASKTGPPASASGKERRSPVVVAS